MWLALPQVMTENEFPILHVVIGFSIGTVNQPSKLN
jgi:hypothetical protein